MIIEGGKVLVQVCVTPTGLGSVACNRVFRSVSDARDGINRLLNEMSDTELDDIEVDEGSLSQIGREHLATDSLPELGTEEGPPADAGDPSPSVDRQEVTAEGERKATGWTL